MVDLKCPECDCTIPPEATKCPNCSHRYGTAAVESQAVKGNGKGIAVSCVGYTTKCEVPGKIYIRASVATAPTRCPFC